MKYTQHGQYVTVPCLLTMCICMCEPCAVVHRKTHTWCETTLSMCVSAHHVPQYHAHGTWCAQTDPPGTVAYPGIFFGGGFNKFS